MLAGLTASGCASSANSPPAAPVVRTQIIRAALPAEARQPCAAPQALPDRALTARETTSKWSLDRTALRVCETRRKAAVAATGGADGE